MIYLCNFQNGTKANAISFDFKESKRRGILRLVVSWYIHFLIIMYIYKWSLNKECLAAGEMCKYFLNTH